MIPAKDIKWQLRLTTWLEVRPYQYPDYTDNVRTTVARSARLRLSDMRIPETDPAWAEVRYRPGPNAGAQQKPRNGILVMAEKKAPKRGAAKVKAAPKVTTPVNRSGKSLLSGPASTASGASVLASSSKGKGKDTEKDRDTEKEEGEISDYHTPPRVIKALRVGAATRSPVTSVPVATPLSKPLPSQPQVAPRAVTGAPLPPSLPTSVATKKAGIISSSAAKESEKPIFVRGRAIKIQKPAVENKKAIKKESASTSTTTKTGTKRKQVEEESDWGYEERRRARQAVSLKKARKDSEAVDAVASQVATDTLKRKWKADESSPAKRVRRDQSPAPVKKGKEMDRSEYSDVASKKRRRSPVSSSSEDDDDDDDVPLLKKAKTKASGTITSGSRNKSSKSSVPRKRKRSLPSNPAELRILYSDTFVEYIAAYSVLYAQRNKLNAMLRRLESEDQSDSDGDVDLLSIGELKELSSRHRQLLEELGEMRRAYDSMV